MGSKSRIAKYIVPIIQECIDDNDLTDYVEPFCGGCNIIDKIDCKNRYANDNNKYLIALYNSLDRLQYLPKEISKEDYDKVRIEYHKYKDDINGESKKYENGFVGAIGFLGSYNRRFFDGGYSGIRTIKNGTTRNYYLESLNNLITQSQNLKDVEFYCCDYRDVLLENYPNSTLIYCDIPYKNTKQYNTSKNFKYKDYYDWCRTYSKNHFILTSEQEMPEDFIYIWEYDINRTIDNNSTKKSTEKLFTHKDGLFYKWWLNNK